MTSHAEMQIPEQGALGASAWCLRGIGSESGSLPSAMAEAAHSECGKPALEAPEAQAQQ